MRMVCGLKCGFSFVMPRLSGTTIPHSPPRGTLISKRKVFASLAHSFLLKAVAREWLRCLNPGRFHPRSCRTGAPPPPSFLVLYLELELHPTVSWCHLPPRILGFLPLKRFQDLTPPQTVKNKNNQHVVFKTFSPPPTVVAMIFSILSSLFSGPFFWPYCSPTTLKKT